MGVNKRRRQDVERQASPFESGVIEKTIADGTASDRDPPWDVVLAYLMNGEHRPWVEGRAACSPAFRDVLDALRNDHHESDERAARRRRNAAALKRKR